MAARWRRAIGLNRICWQRETMVGSRSAVCGAVRINTVRSGGSSNIFNNALPAAGFIRWASATIATRIRAS